MTKPQPNPSPSPNCAHPWFMPQRKEEVAALCLAERWISTVVARRVL
jgi:hypothetical protein